jgi:hypothetical protein
MARSLAWGAKMIATRTDVWPYYTATRVSKGALIVSKCQNKWPSVMVSQGSKFRFIRNGVLAVYISRRGRMITALLDGQVVKTEITGWAIPRKIKAKKV